MINDRRDALNDELLVLKKELKIKKNDFQI